MTDIRRADPDLRARALRALAVAGVAGAALVVAAQALAPTAQAWLTEDLSQTGHRLRLVAGGVAVVFGAPTAWFAATFWRLGARVVAAGQLPVPGMRVTRDTRVLTGAPARWRGRLLQILAVAMVVSVLVLVLLIWRFAGLVDARV